MSNYDGSWLQRPDDFVRNLPSVRIKDDEFCAGEDVVFRI